MLVLSGPRLFMILPNFLKTSRRLSALVREAWWQVPAEESDCKRRQLRNGASIGGFRTSYLILLQRKASMPFST